MRASPSQEEVRRHNLGTLLRYVHVHGATSRAELTTRLGLYRKRQPYTEKEFFKAIYPQAKRKTSFSGELRDD